MPAKRENQKAPFGTEKDGSGRGSVQKVAATGSKILDSCLAVRTNYGRAMQFNHKEFSSRGGKARAKNLSAAKRKEIAANAAKARWAKENGKRK